MKKVVLIICALLVSIFAGAQISANAKSSKKGKQSHQYCAKMKDGLLVMMEDDHEMTMDVTLSNGTRVKTDGSVIKTDGTVVILEEGECIDENGNIYPSPGKTRIKTESGKKVDEVVPPQKKE